MPFFLRRTICEPLRNDYEISRRSRIGLTGRARRKDAAGSSGENCSQACRKSDQPYLDR